MECKRPITEYGATKLLPEEIWRNIFSYLSDFQLAKSVIPVCHLFQNLAYEVGFRRCGADDSGANLGHDWMQWHDHHPDFLGRICAKRLHFKLSEEHHRCHDHGECTSPPCSTLPYATNQENCHRRRFAFPSLIEDQTENHSLYERTKMIDTVKAFPGLETLKVEHTSYEHFDGPGRHPIANSSSNRFSWIKDCPTATAEFLDGILYPVQFGIKDLELCLYCVCSCQEYHLSRCGCRRPCYGHELPLPIFGTLQATPICACTELTSLTLVNAISGRAFELFAACLAKLKNLRLANCGDLKGFDLKNVSNSISEGALSNLESLRLRELRVKGADLNVLFTSNPTWAGALTALDIHFSPDIGKEIADERGVDLNPIFRVSVGLQNLTLIAPLNTAPDFEAVTDLSHLELRIYDMYMPRFPSGEPPPTPAPWDKIAPLTSLTIDLDGLPPLDASVSWPRCFGQLRSLKLFRYRKERSDASARVKKILSVCGSSLKIFVMPDIYLYGGPLEIANETDFQFTTLHLEEYRKKLWQNLPSSNFRFLVHFKMSSMPNEGDDPSLVAFILRVCEAAESSLKHLELTTELPVENLPMVARLRKLETLTVCFYENMVFERERLKSFVRACNRIFPVVRIDDNTFMDELSTFPALRDFKLMVECYNTSSRYAYNLRKTCFGKIKRFLRLSDTDRYWAISPSDVANDTIPPNDLFEG